MHDKDCIYVVVPRLTKFTHFFAISSEYKASQVAELYFRKVFRPRLLGAGSGSVSGAFFI
jgi:hypothetical protein